MFLRRVDSLMDISHATQKKHQKLNNNYNVSHCVQNKNNFWPKMTDLPWKFDKIQENVALKLVDARECQKVVLIYVLDDKFILICGL